MPTEPAEKKRERRRISRKKSEPERRLLRKLRRNLPVVREEVRVEPDELPDGTTLADYRPIGDGEIVRRIEHVREHLVVVEYHLQTLAAKEGDLVIKASSPPTVIPGTHYGPGVYAHMITAKCDQRQLLLPPGDN